MWYVLVQFQSAVCYHDLTDKQTEIYSNISYGVR